jgi:hypothetical protein
MVERSDTMLMPLCRAIASHDINRVSRLLNKSPALARESAEAGASREKAVPYYLTRSITMSTWATPHCTSRQRHIA